MSLQESLGGQIRAALAMLRQCIERCPDDVWAAGNHPRAFWRIAYHSLYFTHLYAMPTEADFVAWDKDQEQARILWDDDEDEIPPREVTYSQSEIIEYLDFIDMNMQAWIDKVDFDSVETGFSWYQKQNKMDHMLLNLRHFSIHIGQLQELLYTSGIVLDWVSVPNA